ncbi:hypothetical protein ACFFMM_10850 [Micromonospora chaiyaphumensis]|uniref:AMP-binding enzyme n=1 Tax=Micromonospora chaiyaphumensis TaxID=307119 RepID=UPI001FCA004F|nr:hypothetical protein [Micromonospora chaiyaphumensis]
MGRVQRLHSRDRGVAVRAPGGAGCGRHRHPRPKLGEQVCAAVALKDGATPEELREHVEARAALYKYPRHVWIVDKLPKTATGKIRKR